jgi:hypothetical protein
MIKQGAKIKLKIIFWPILVFLISFILQVNFAIALFLLCLYSYAKLRRLNFSLPNITLLFLIIFCGSYFSLKENWQAYFLPFALTPMLATLLFNNLEISFIITLASSVAVASLSGNPFQLGLLFLISGIFSIILVYGARKRITIIRAGFIVGIIQVATLIFIERFWSGSPARYLIFMLNGIVSSVIVLGILPLFEYLFKTFTNISLLELADFNHPLLQRLILEAPGTYHHSLMVGNLCESACLAVGANALLARIGAYYHDIGKLSKPGYFSENQTVKESKHDTLTPAMSKLIIMNHVKEGIDLAKKCRLNPALMDFIQQHHGTGLVFYFYRRALENLEEDQRIEEEVYRYPGPKPGTKETAIVLLADSVEAATRSLRDPTPEKIKEMVHKVINNKFIEGQLDECDLTLKDLEKISAVFIRILSGIYHSRVIYPEESRSENNHKKFPKENSRQSDKDKKDNS